MGYSDIPVQTDTERILAELANTQERLQALTEAVNGLGTNVDWIVQNAQGIFQMFSNPAFMSMLPNMLGGTPDGSQE